MLDVRTAERKSERAYQAACATLWPAADPKPNDFLQPPRTREQAEAYFQEVIIDQTTVEDTDKPDVKRIRGPGFLQPVRRVGKDWKYDGVVLPYDPNPFFKRGLPKRQIETRIRNEIAQEVLDGKYKDSFEAGKALRTRTNQALDEAKIKHLP
jgi:hypothetical protein